MTKTTVNVTPGTATVAELRDLACQFQARINVDANDTAAGYLLGRVNSELFRRQRLCRADHPDASAHTICALLDGHGGDHRALTGSRWA